MQDGTVFWLTGLAGSGKTSIAMQFVSYLQSTTNLKIVYLDGDKLRAIFGETTDYSRENRHALAFCYAKLCHMLSLQGITVVCAVMALFNDVQDWNRQNINNYIEIFIRVPMTILSKRDKKKLYSRALSGKISNVVGFDIVAEFPRSADCIIDNYGDMTMEEAIRRIKLVSEKNLVN